MKSTIVEYRSSLIHDFQPAIADHGPAGMVVGGCRPSAGMVGRTLSQLFDWHGWEGVIYVDGRRQGAGLHFPASERIIAELPGGQKVMHSASTNGDGGCYVDGVHYAGIIEAVLALAPSSEQ